eukprot:2468645-Pyramimonas_sp.AAC.1
MGTTRAAAQRHTFAEAVSALVREAKDKDRAAALGLNEPLYETIPEDAVQEKAEALYQAAVDKISKEVTQKEEEERKKHDKEKEQERELLAKDPANLLELVIDARIDDKLKHEPEEASDRMEDDHQPELHPAASKFCETVMTKNGAAPAGKPGGAQHIGNGKG